MAQVITIAGERLFALKAQNNEQLDIDTFIFANVPGQDPNATIDRNESVPPVGQQVHQQIVQQVGRVNDNVVIYSTVLDSVTGPFDFNWVGLYSSVNQTLIAVSHIPSVSKTITVPGAAGNTLNRNFGIEYSGIADLTGISIAPETWQLDFTARLSGMDELTRQLAADMNGKDWFIGDGFKVVLRSTANTFNVTAGAGYVSGLRVELKQDHILTLQSYPQFVYVDAWFDGDASSQWKPKTAFTVTNGEMDDYIDVNGKQHYVFKLARIIADDVVEDFRNVQGLPQKINKHIENLDNAHDKTYSRIFDTVEQMVKAKLPAGIIVKTKGRLIFNDGLGAEYITQTLEDFNENPDNVVDFLSTGTDGLILFNLRVKDTQPTAYAKDFKRFTWGNEYLFALTKALWVNQNLAPKCIFSGDSTTKGDFQVGEPNSPVIFTPSLAMDRLGRYYGTPLNTINAGHSGATTVQWASDFVAEDIAAHPDMVAYFAKWGINDASIHGDPALYEEALDDGLSQLREFKSVDSLTIILMMPSSVYDPDHGRTAAWMERIIEINYRMAQKHLCYFFDTYALIRDTVNGGGLWIDAPTISGIPFGHIHPSNEHNMWVYGKLASEILQPSTVTARNTFNVLPESYRASLFSSAPNDYEYGVTLERALTSNGWPSEGIVKTTSHINGNVVQELYGFEGNKFTYKMRSGISFAWDINFSGNIIAVNPATGWSVISGYAPLSCSIDSHGWVTLEGSLTYGSKPTLGTVIGVVPEGFRPSEIIVASGVSGNAGLNTLGAVNILPNGEIQIAAVGDTGNISLAGARYRAI